MNLGKTMASCLQAIVFDVQIGISLMVAAQLWLYSRTVPPSKNFPILQVILDLMSLNRFDEDLVSNSEKPIETLVKVGVSEFLIRIR